MNNLNLIFNKLYYERIGKKDFDEDVKNKNKEIFSSVFNYDEDYVKSEIANTEFVMKTTYPGLLLGHGGHHGSGKSEADISSGMDFDYVTGQPYIAATAIKGVLHSVFIVHKKAVLEIIKTTLDKEFTEEELDLLEEEIFDGCDIFLDAVVYDGDEYGRVVGKDYFSPQGNDLKTPLPVLVIKVLPGVRFEFRFVLSDGILTKEEKSALFFEIISVFGIGARTNVGYGKMVPCNLEIHTKKTYNKILPKDKRQECIICPKCGAKNYKYKIDLEYKFVTNVINPNWTKGICHKADCGGELK